MKRDDLQWLLMHAHPAAIRYASASSCQLVSAFQHTLPTSCNSNRSKVGHTLSHHSSIIEGPSQPTQRHVPAIILITSSVWGLHARADLEQSPSVQIDSGDPPDKRWPVRPGSSQLWHKLCITLNHPRFSHRKWDGSVDLMAKHRGSSEGINPLWAAVGCRMPRKPADRVFCLNFATSASTPTHRQLLVHRASGHIRPSASTMDD